MPEFPDLIVGFPDPFNVYGHRIVITCFYVLAIFTTLARLSRRIRIRRFSWDDLCATIALVLILVKMAIEWVRLGKNVQPRTNSKDDVDQFQSDIKVFFAIQTSLFSGVVWVSRVSLSLSVARILPPGRLRKTAICVAVACFLFGTMLVALKCATCTVQFTPLGPQPTCVKGRFALLLQTVGGVVSSCALVLFPIHALRLTSTELRSDERRLIYAMFASAVLTLAVGLSQTMFVTKKNRFASTYCAILEASISLMVCNLLVVMAFLARVLSRHKLEAADEEEYNSGEDAISLTSGTPTRHQEISRSRSYSDISIQTQLTELGDSVKTYSLRSLDMTNEPSTSGHQVGECSIPSRTMSRGTRGCWLI